MQKAEAASKKEADALYEANNPGFVHCFFIPCPNADPQSSSGMADFSKLVLGTVGTPAGGAAGAAGAGATGAKLAGSGPVAGVIEVSGQVKSVAAFKNYYPKNGLVEYVFDPKTGRFAVGNPAAHEISTVGLSPHQRLAKSIDADTSTVVGGELRRGPKGEFFTDEMSGHFYQNWDYGVRLQFLETMESYGITIKHGW
ncbi:polymorphic toxin type 43 domain-containing protein [Acrocarpospora sp. B8E8]|uniref:polymorphic toxin type 43 domain-containing protein n=1 Tax=Acrocarpospora sp. B8E8 TaxID=3153572 RepID=UPI00325E1D44